MNESLTVDGDCPKLLQHFKLTYPIMQWKSEGFFEDQHLLDIDCHWMTFEPTRSSVHFLLTIIYVIVFLIGFFSNSLAIYIVSSTKKLLTPANILLINLAISDITTVLMIPIFLFNSFHQGPAIGKLGCTLYGFLTGLSGTCSIMTLTAVSVERYLVISQPLNTDWKPTRRWAYFTSLSAWLYSALFASLPLFGVGKYVPEGFLTGCSFDYLSNDLTTRIFILVFFIGAWMIPMIIIFHSYLAIIRTVVLVRRDVTEITNNVPVPTDGNILSLPNIEMEVAKTIMGLIGAWTIAWTPYAIVSLIGISGYGHLLTPFSTMLPSLFAKLATCVDPFIYTLSQPKIRKEILRRLHLLPPPMNPSGGGNPYYYNGPTDGPNSRRPMSRNDNNSSRRTGSQQQAIAGQHRRSITTSNNTRRAQAYSSLIGRVIIEENIIGPVMMRNSNSTPGSLLLKGDERVAGELHHGNSCVVDAGSELREVINNTPGDDLVTNDQHLPIITVACDDDVM